MGRKATQAQLAALAKGRATLRAKRKRGLARRGPGKKKGAKGAGFFGDAWNAIKGAGKAVINEGVKEGKRRAGKAAQSFLAGGLKQKRGGTVIAGGLGKGVSATDRRKAKAIVVPVQRARKAYVQAQRVAIKKHRALITSIKKRSKAGAVRRPRRKKIY